MKKKVGIAGFGVVGKRRRDFIEKMDELELIAVCDQTFDGSGFLDDGIKYFSNYKDLICQDIEAVFICISNDMAARVTIDSLEAGLHVFCEKPPCRNLSEMQQVLSCEKNHPDLKLMYGFNHRYHLSVRDALDIIDSNKLGRVLNLRGVYGKSQLITFGKDHDWRTSRELAGGGILLDQGIHMVDLMRLLGGEYTRVHSMVSNRFWNHDVEDNAFALMRTDNGIIAMLHSSATQWRHSFSLEVTLEKGILALSGILSGSKSYGSETLKIINRGRDDRGDPIEEIRQYDDDPSWKDEISDFVEALFNRKKIKDGNSSEAFKTLKLVYDIYCADEDWKSQWGLDNISK